jgi:hypothetical protein
LILVGFEKSLLGFYQHLPMKCSVFLLLCSAKHNQPVGIAVTSAGYYNLNVGLFSTELYNDSVFFFSRRAALLTA